MVGRWLIATLVMTTTAVAPAAADETHPCANAATRCDGTVQVPLNWSDPASERITVPFSWLPHRNRDRPSAGTIVALPGGPASVMGQFNAFADSVGPLLDDYDFLMVERRGFGTTALMCAQIDIRSPESVSACAAQLGPRVQYFTADQRVADIDAVRAALGVRKVILYGNSYGSIEGPAYASRFPQHTEAGIFDSPTLLPDRRTGYLTGHSFQENLEADQRAINDVCQRSSACRALPGDMFDRLAAVARTLREHPDIPVGSLVSVTRAIDPVTARDSNAALQAYLDGDKEPLRRLVKLAGPPPNAGTPNDGFLRDGVGAMAYVCNDVAWPYDRHASPEVRRAQLAAHRATNPEHPVTSAESTFGFGVWDDWCLGWPTPRSAPPVAGQYPDIPVLAIAGSFDSDAGANAAELAGQFRRGRAMVVPFAGHATSVLRPNSTYQPCAAQAVRNFITGRPLPTCSGENFRALGRFPLAGKDVVTTTFRTAMDALTSRIPNSVGVIRYPELPGLRGGKIVFTGPTAVLDQVRYTEDTVVSGEIRLDGDEATADLTANGSQLRLRWKPFEAKEIFHVTGTRDGKPFVAWLTIG